MQRQTFLKAFNTANHKLLIDILRRYGAPPKFATAIERIYCNNTCVLKIKHEIAEILQSVGVRQGDNMAPVLFLFLMTAFAKTLELVWKQLKIPILSIMTAADENPANGKICSHIPARFRSKKLTAYKILQCLYADNGTFSFGTRADLQQGMELIYHNFAQFGLEMHIGHDTSESKTECIFFPPTTTSSNTWNGQILLPAPSNAHFSDHTTQTPDASHHRIPLRDHAPLQQL
jgi:hypothetical protein